MPSLRRLVRSLPGDLIPVGDPAPARLDAEVSAVHVSELLDPTPYLDGGELLLTTGLGLTGQITQARAYATRLAERGLVGLAIGLGPVHQQVPPALAAACAAAGLPLLVVPVPTPFLAVTRAYWSLLTAAGHAELSAALGAHRDLARAATTRNPVSAVVRVLANSVQGWAARLGPDGELIEVWPRRRHAVAVRLRGDVERLRAAGPHASATFSLDGEDVIVHPLTRTVSSAAGAGPSALVGFVAIGCERPIRSPDRGVVLTACTLLSAVLDHGLARTAARRAERACVVRLVLAGRVDAARELAAQLGEDALPHRARVVLVAGADPLTSDEVLDRLEEERGGTLRRLWAWTDGDVLVLLVPDGVAEPVERALRRVRDGAAAGLRAVGSPVAPLGSVPMDPLRAALAGVAPGEIALDSAGASSAEVEVLAREQLARLTAYRRAPLVPAVAAYLGHRGNWEQAAKTLGVHRNTLRQRIARASRVAAVDLDDPDTAAHLWLALRATGHA